ncbi:MAG TPA: MlaD family protein [Candidatus Gastranaerophilaceae bacterium]|nr:MlaD family protein [Candidatus Gastranaerophilaceae bacterium]HPT41902.1 MlaD family protein [Candidatus Gastranaerophilaceae bacterium]
MRFSSSFKVGILALIALFILLFTILWVKGRSFSSAARMEIVFKDVNGMRPGSGVQMMGLRVGQVEEIIPFIDGENSFVKMKFVITEPGISIPKASVFSIQQSGLIGEQFLEITPPKTRTTYFSVYGGSDLLYKNDPVQIKLDNKYYDVGKVKDTQILSAKMVPAIMQEKIKTPYAYKIDYVITLPGLIMPDYMLGSMIKDKGVNKLRLQMIDNTVLPYPHQSSPYTVVEPMRIADFMDLQYKAAESLTETNIKINELLSDNVIADLKQTVSNINALTAQATTTIAKAEKLVDASKEDLDSMVAMANKVSTSFIKLADNINGVVGDENFKPTLISTAKSIDKLSQNLNKILDNTDAKQLGADLQSIANNLNDISTFVSTMTKDEKLKKQLSDTILKVNTAMTDISSAMELVNSMTPENKRKIEQIMEDTSATTHNLRKFSDKLNKRFLLFRLMF